MKFSIILALALLLFTSACNTFTSDISDDVLVEYSGEYLLMSQIAKELESCENKEDSTTKIDAVKKQWLKHQLIIAKAEKELPSTELDIEMDVLQYKADLLRYKFDNYYIKKKINTQVSKQEVQDFYETNKSVLRANQTLVKAVYIELPKDVKDKYKVKPWLISSKEKDQDKLKVYCFQNAKVFDDFENSWIELSRLRLMSKSDQLVASNVKKNKVFEFQNEDLSYYILISELIKPGQTMPIDYAEEKIAEMIINNRKRDLRNELDKKLNEQVANMEQ